MAYLVKSADVFVGGEIVFDGDQARFSGGRNIGVVPALYDCNGHYVEPVNQWFLRLVAGKGLQDLSSYSRAMLRYWSFLERHDDLQWDKFLPAKALKPTYRFRNQDLLPAAKAGELAWSTANTYISHLVQFYLWTARKRYYQISDHHKPFEVEFVTIHNDSMLAHMAPKLVVQTSDLRIKVPKNATTERVRSLEPLSPDELHVMGQALRDESTEFRLICALGAQSGLRIEEASGMTLTALDTAVPTSELKNRFHVKIGPAQGVPTKYDVPRTIELSRELLSRLRNYSLSERRLDRLDKITDTLKYEPLFITQRGNPYRTASVQSLWNEFRKSIRAVYKVPFEHRFHDLRCSYGTYRLHSLLEAKVDETEALSLLMGWMGHKNEQTTWHYLRYLRRKEALKEKISMLDNIMHDALQGGNDEW